MVTLSMRAIPSLPEMTGRLANGATSGAPEGCAMSENRVSPATGAVLVLGGVGSGREVATDEAAASSTGDEAAFRAAEGSVEFHAHSRTPSRRPIPAITPAAGRARQGISRRAV